MKRYFIFISILLCSFVIKAQTNNPPVVALDKMNVLYYGLDNPITIGSPVDFSQVKLSVTNGTISGTGTQRIVRPASSDKKTTLTIDINGEKTSYDFRVKRIPDPVFKIGSGKKRMAVTEFKNQSFCRAELYNFDFDLRYNVISTTVYFSGNGFETVSVVNLNGSNLGLLSAFRSKCVAGSIITFTNIKIEGPDGVRNIDEQTYTLF